MHSSSGTDRIVAVCAIITAVAAVGIATYETRITREHNVVSVWPYLQQYNVFHTAEAYEFQVTNAGIGPAIVGSFRVFVDGQPMQGWGSVIQQLTATTPDASSQHSGVGKGTVILPGSIVEVLRIGPGETATRFWQQMQTKRVSIRICYCSLYGECWETGHQAEPLPMTNCRADPEMDFVP